MPLTLTITDEQVEVAYGMVKTSGEPKFEDLPDKDDFMKRLTAQLLGRLLDDGVLTGEVASVLMQLDLEQEEAGAA